MSKLSISAKPFNPLIIKKPILTEDLTAQSSIISESPKLTVKPIIYPSPSYFDVI